MREKHQFLSKKIAQLLRNHWLMMLELSIILFFALFVGRKYLDFDPNRFIEGGEFVLTTISHHAWNLLTECGSCVFWSGYLNGGSPSFVELHGAFLHPLVIITTLLWGVINGSKVVVLVSLITVGLGQWWLARELKLSFFPRLWVSLMAIAGGHIFGKLQAGNVVLVLSIACASLILPMVIRLKRDPSKRNVGLLALILAMTWLSGQGYNQLVVLLAYFPAILWYLLQGKGKRFIGWRKLIFASLLSVLLISILVVPFIHFQGNWQKLRSPAMDSVQPLEYSMLNLVIHDWKFFDNTSLDKTLSPWAHINFIGWPAVLLMISCLLFINASIRKRELILMYAAMMLALVFSSRDPYILFADEVFVAQLRSLNVAAGLAIQPLLIIAGVALQELIERNWLNIELTISAGAFSKKIPPLKWILLLGLMFMSIRSPYEYGAKFINTRPINIPESELALLDSDQAQWVGPLNYDWLPVLIERGYKLIIPDKPWSWKERQIIEPYIEVIDFRNDEVTKGIVDRLGNLVLVADETQEYASIINGDSITPCSAVSRGGNVDVTCETDEGGILQVREYYWSGWNAWVYNSPVELDESKDFLTVTAGGGTHHFRFRYQPWDVYLGMGLSAIGLALCAFLLAGKKQGR